MNAPKKKPKGPGASFVQMLWMQPLMGIPFALFFGTIMGRGGGLESYVRAYNLSLVMAFGIGLTIWFTRFFLMPFLERRGVVKEDTPGWMHASYYMVMSLLASYASGIVIHLWIMPGFLGSGRAIAVAGMFSLLFASLFTGINMAIYYYRESLTRVRADQELNLARRIQRSFLLTQFPALPRVELHALNLSSKEVSGDFYDVVPAGNGSYLLAIADVAGKGVPAALLTSMLQASLRTQAGVTHSVAAILKNINQLVYRSTQENQFATFFLARIEEESLRLSFCNAGHNYPIVFRDEGAREFLVRGGVVVGILEDAQFEEETVTLRPGDRLVFYTDGVSEAANPAGELYGEDRLYDLITSMPRELSAREVTDRIVDSVNQYLAGAEAGDDITLMVLRVREPHEAAGAVSGR
ncbi:MAG: PP2C family protein-serine/threonine phosphatase [Candidatus Eisenbacteria bacterium]